MKGTGRAKAGKAAKAGNSAREEVGVGMAKSETLSRSYVGQASRYLVEEVRTRFGDVVWFVSDAEVLDDVHLPSVIRQAATREEALRGLVVGPPPVSVSSIAGADDDGDFEGARVTATVDGASVVIVYLDGDYRYDRVEVLDLDDFLANAAPFLADLRNRLAVALGRACEACAVALAADDTCPACGVLHGEPCVECSRRGYHVATCRVVRA